MPHTPLYRNSLSFAHTKNNTLETIKTETSTITISKVIETPFNFSNLILSPCVFVPQNSSVLLEAKIFKDTQETPWLNIIKIEHKHNTSFDPQESNIGKLNIDNFTCASYATAVQYRITITGKAMLLGLTNTIIKNDAEFNLNEAVKGDIKAVKLNVPPISQITNGRDIKERICSPTCVTMLLKYYAFKDSLFDVVDAVYDKQNDIYGNWLFNTIYAGNLGLDSYVTRINTLEQAYNIVSCGTPIIASITFTEGELDNAPKKSTKGHLVLIKGFDDKGNIIVNDPAAPTDDTVERIYDKEQFAKVWLGNKMGLSYIIVKPNLY
ncbi:hypothetical protein AAIR98_000434 [Elusimicrobium simillimum]|uniref:C39 family peptidase n=1 Tax=Elusimicrobium simillimum TaxID=3143438 RepID=UPI003C6F47F4